MSDFKIKVRLLLKCNDLGVLKEYQPEELHIILYLCDMFIML